MQFEHLRLIIVVVGLIILPPPLFFTGRKRRPLGIGIEAPAPALTKMLYYAILKQESLADAKVSGRQQCVYESP